MDSGFCLFWTKKWAEKIGLVHAGGCILKFLGLFGVRVFLWFLNELGKIADEAIACIVLILIVIGLIGKNAVDLAKIFHEILHALLRSGGVDTIIFRRK